MSCTPYLFMNDLAVTREYGDHAGELFVIDVGLHAFL